MSLSMRRSIWFLLALGVFVPTIRAQSTVDERPEVLKLTREDLERRKAEELVREARTIFGLGVMRQRGDRWLEAVALLEQAAKLDPQTPAAYRALIPLYLSLAREDDAQDACRKVLLVNPNDVDTAFQLAKLQKADGRPRDAIATLKQGVGSKLAESRIDRLHPMLNDLAGLQEEVADFPGAIVSYRRLARLLIDERFWLVGSETIKREDHAVAVARAYERIGHCCLKEKHFADAVKAFEDARDYLDQQPSAEIRSKAARLNWNLAQAFLSQEKWAEALSYLDSYLEHRPADPEPFEKKVELLRKLDRERDILPAMKKYAGRSPDVLGIQLLYVRELARLPRNRVEAETRYLELSERFSSPEVYRGLFKLYQASDRMIEVLDLVDKVFTTVTTKDDIAAEVRERARERGRAMLQVLRSEPGIVGSLLPVALEELRIAPKRSFETWQFLAALAARAKQLDKAETLFRQCLVRVPPNQEATVYAGLLEILWKLKKYDSAIALCKDALYGPRKAEATNQVLFHRSLALALSEKDKIDEAVVEIDKAIKMGNEAQKVFLRCGKARMLALADRYDPAVSECETMLKDLTQASEITQVRHTLALIWNFKGDHDKSEAQLLQILEDDPNDAGANNDLGYQWADRSVNIDRAEKMIRKAIEVDHIQRHDDPEDDRDNAAYLDSLGWVLFRTGKLEEARDWLEKAAAHTGGVEDPTVWDHLGDVYYKLDQPAKAKQAWQTAVKLYAGDRRGKREGRLDEAKRKLKIVAE